MMKQVGTSTYRWVYLQIMILYAHGIFIDIPSNIKCQPVRGNRELRRHFYISFSCLHPDSVTSVEITKTNSVVYDEVTLIFSQGHNIQFLTK